MIMKKEDITLYGANESKIIIISPTSILSFILKYEHKVSFIFNYHLKFIIIF